MRILLFTILCLSAIACITATNFLQGQRQKGDHVVTNRTIRIPVGRRRARIATIGISTHSSDQIINFVNITSIQDKEVTYVVSKGGIGLPFIVIKAIGQQKEGLNLYVEGFAKLIQSDESSSSSDESSSSSSDDSSSSSPDNSSSSSSDSSSSSSPDSSSSSSPDSSSSSSSDDSSSSSPDNSSSSSSDSSSSSSPDSSSSSSSDDSSSSSDNSSSSSSDNSNSSTSDENSNATNENSSTPSSASSNTSNSGSNNTPNNASSNYPPQVASAISTELKNYKSHEFRDTRRAIFQHHSHDERHVGTHVISKRTVTNPRLPFGDNNTGDNTKMLDIIALRAHRMDAKVRSLEMQKYPLKELKNRKRDGMGAKGRKAETSLLDLLS
ncbi:hypothetical protein EAG_01183 [Camponotus floridanus]|uniref:Uncharacterized protein n=1 Tax=Camponotus floridanus TaxID=104421 RepID=E2APG1_CAMFO|nr:hypothetical protein EAG_01183 [Camponotus floridanus]